MVDVYKNGNIHFKKHEQWNYADESSLNNLMDDMYYDASMVPMSDFYKDENNNVFKDFYSYATKKKYTLNVGDAEKWAEGNTIIMYAKNLDEKDKEHFSSDGYLVKSK